MGQKIQVKKSRESDDKYSNPSEEGKSEAGYSQGRCRFARACTAFLFI